MSTLNGLFQQELEVANIGIQSFYEDLKKQDFKAIHVDFRPVAGGNEKLAAMLDLLK